MTYYLLVMLYSLNSKLLLGGYLEIFQLFIVNHQYVGKNHGNYISSNLKCFNYMNTAQKQSTIPESQRTGHSQYYLDLHAALKIAMLAAGVNEIIIIIIIIIIMTIIIIIVIIIAAVVAAVVVIVIVVVVVIAAAAVVVVIIKDK